MQQEVIQRDIVATYWRMAREVAQAAGAIMDLGL
jgi:hypothetical protein